MKKCFVISPISEPGSDIRRRTDGLIESVIRPVMGDLECDVEIAHKIDETGSISKQIIERVLEADLVIANLTFINPNVMYELSIRHCACLPVVTIAETGTVLPFDISDQRTIFYLNDFSGVLELKKELLEQAKLALASDQVDNPVFNAMQRKVLAEIGDDASDREKLFHEYFQKLEGGLVRLERMVQSSMVISANNALQHSTLSISPNAFSTPSSNPALNSSGLGKFWVGGDGGGSSGIPTLLYSNPDKKAT